MRRSRLRLRLFRAKLQRLPEIRLGLSAYLPERYIADPNQRLVLYRKLASAVDDVEIYQTADELRDRYGELPEEAVLLLDVERLPDDHLGLDVVPQVDVQVPQVGQVLDLLDTHELTHNTVVIVLSEYGITAATGVVTPNRALRDAGLLRVQVNATGELLDAGASRAFAVCDHQIAHVYVADPADRARSSGGREAQALTARAANLQ